MAIITPGEISGHELGLRTPISGTANNDTLSAWAEDSGNARHFAQGSASLEPTYKTGISETGKPGVFFDNADWMAGDNWTLADCAFMSDGSDFTIAIVFQIPATISGTEVLLDNTNLNVAARGILVGILDNKLYMSIRGNSTQKLSLTDDDDELLTADTTHVWIITFEDGVADNGLIYYLNGVAVAQNATSGISWDSGNPVNAIDLGVRSSGIGNIFSGYVFAIDIYSQKLNDTDRQGLSEYYVNFYKQQLVSKEAKQGHLSPVIIYGNSQRKITFPREFNVYDPERISEIRRQIAGDGTPYTLKFFTKYIIGLEKVLISPQLRRQLDDLHIFAEGGASFSFAYDDRIGLFMDFEGQSILTNDGVSMTTARTGAAYSLNPATGLVESAAENTARFEAGYFGEYALKLERDSVNYCQQSDDFSTTWVASNITVTTNIAYLPDHEGTFTADKLAATAANGTITYTTSQASVGIATFSVYIRSVTGDVAGTIYCRDSTDEASAAFTANESWQRIEVTLNHGSPSGNLEIEIEITTSGDFILAKRAQVESGHYRATSDMPSSGSNGTRGNEYHIVTLGTEDISLTKGTLSWWIKPKEEIDDGVAKYFISILTNSNEDFLKIRKDSSNNIVASSDAADGSVTAASASVAASDFMSTDTWVQVVVTYDFTSSNSIKIYADSVLQVTSSNTTGFPPLQIDTPLKLVFGDIVGNTDSMNCLLDEVILWKGIVLSQTEINYYYNLGESLGIHRNRWDDVILESMNFEEQPGARRYNAEIVLREK